MCFIIKSFTSSSINRLLLKGYKSKSFNSSPFFSHPNHNLQSNVEYKFIDRSDYDLIAWRKKNSLTGLEKWLAKSWLCRLVWVPIHEKVMYLLLNIDSKYLAAYLLWAYGWIFYYICIYSNELWDVYLYIKI